MDVVARASPLSQKPRYLALPPAAASHRARSRTLTTPMGTPSGESVEEHSEFITREMLLAMNTPKGRHWDTLPPELKSHVLSFLSATDRIRCMAVNREIHQLVLEGSLWQTLDTSSFYSKIPSAQLLRLVHRAAPFVQNLNLRGCAQLKRSTILQLNNLVRASFEGCRFFTSSSLMQLLQRNTRLRHLDVSGLNAVDDQTLRTIMSNCPLLESLNISYCKHVSTAVLKDLAHTLVNLQDLRLGEYRIDQETVRSINKLQHLKRLSLAGCSTFENAWMKDLIYGALEYGVILPETRIKSSLVHLDISRCARLSSDCLKYMRWVLPNLQKLELAGMTTMADIDMAEVLPTLTSLTHIDLEDCAITDTTLGALATCSGVGHIQLSHCAHISDTGVLQLIESLPLNHIDLDNTNISDRVLSAIAAKSQPMRVSIYDCPHLSWTGVLSILTANSQRPQGLKRLKTFYGWQRPVDGHSKRCSRGDIQGAKEIEKEWATYMMDSSESVMRTGEGRTRFLDLDEEGLRIVGRERSRRARACVIM